MTRYHALVLVPGDAATLEEDACDAAAKLLYLGAVLVRAQKADRDPLLGGHDHDRHG